MYVKLFLMFSEYQYTYLLMACLFLVVWIILFLLRKDNRGEMIFVSVVIALLGPASNIVFIVDWWKPMTIWGPDVAILESLLTGFGMGGVAAVIYEDVFKKKLKPRKIRNKEADKWKLLFLVVSTACVGYFLFYALGLNSFIATNGALLYGVVFILLQRRDLIVESIVSGILFFFVAAVVYTILEFLTPGWVEAFWYWQNVPKITILNVPIDDVVHYFLAGAWVGVLYEFWQEAKLVSINNKNT